LIFICGLRSSEGEDTQAVLNRDAPFAETSARLVRHNDAAVYPGSS